MKNFICIILYISTLSLYAQRDGNHPAQSDANIFGHVLDRKTKEHLPYVTIKLQGTTIGITTDASGHYFLRNLPTGNFRLEASMIGYKTFTREVTIRPNSTLEIDFELEEENVSLDAVVISANRNETTRRMAPSLVRDRKSVV